MDGEAVREHASRRDLAPLLEADQLRAAQRCGAAFSEYREGAIDWEGAIDEGYEAIRNIRDFPDAFEPDFELGTDDHAEWVKNARAEFE